MKFHSMFVVVMFVMLLNGCKPDKDTGITINNRTNASVIITNETTGDVLNKVSNDADIIQAISIGESDLSEPEMIIHNGDVLKITYYPHSRFKDFSVSMSVLLDGVEVCKKDNSPYEISYEVSPVLDKGIVYLTIVGTYGQDGDEYYLYETMAIKVKVE